MKKVVLASLLSLASFTSAAQWQAGAGLVQLSNSEDDQTIKLTALVAEAKYSFHKTDKVEWLVGARYGFGIQDDEFDFAYGAEIDVELDRFVSIDLRAQFAINEQAYFFLTPSYTNAKYTAKFQYFSESESDWELGGGLGLGYQFNEATAVEASYQRFDETNALGVSFSYKF
ncbi:outer membrane beta-barrel protein [Thalassotalea marina]|uniref:Outer membrane protein beta-barrel domain-containing protein n=1 Tax=Thalassotalea marina TaxID=1673741 RepID=A0A919EJR6_9GAMM|nr:outer membrane beta-barrel protein [Thalassotalea marina]GHF86795.1 hypothetical protein GCM10017161_12830 [Thalassotalea marina]